jgi:four helix bundle protein
MGYEQFEGLRRRSFRFALDITQLCRGLPARWEAVRLRDQLFRAATSVAANYRAASRGRSPAEFIAKIGLVVEEADECEFWLLFSKAAELQSGPELARLTKEAGELLAIFGASLNTAKKNRKQANQEKRRKKRQKRTVDGAKPSTD